jgi:diaminohydroxyphosphoribosylaminopyrimidine deaminase/5-amino-6-(5-phosphoribosylamino)uracil reductase
MSRALRLAALGRHASPNPMVGCVLVNAQGQIVGEGYHHRPGEAHAEVNALGEAGSAAAGSTAYVALEPCAHYGRTPPCAVALVAAGITRVVAAMSDPDPRVAGKGFEILRAAGIEVVPGVLQTQASELNAAYIKHRTTGMPWFVMKTAMSLDGKIATKSGDSRWITSPIARGAVHRQLRDRADAILTGVGTIVKDDPSLTTRLGYRQGRNPIRIIVDSHCRTRIDSQVVQLGKQDRKTLIATTLSADPVKVETLARSGCQILICDSDLDGRVSLVDLMKRLGTRGDIIGVIGEAGGELAASFLQYNLVDRLLVFVAPKIVGGTEAPGPFGGAGIEAIAQAMQVSRWRIKKCGPDILIDAHFGGKIE